jgi:hypothetical protein
MPLIFELTDLSVHEGKDTRDTVLGFAKKNTARKFDLAKGPLMATVSIVLLFLKIFLNFFIVIIFD